MEKHRAYPADGGDTLTLLNERDEIRFTLVRVCKQDG
jgi:hypothetical protein